MENKFGIYMIDNRCKVTNQPREFQWGTVVPCQIGFKDSKTDEWCNIWVDVNVTEKTQIACTVNKGDVISVSGRMLCREYQGQPKWSVWADSVKPFGQQSQQQTQRAPFDGGSEMNGDQIPF